MKRISLLAVLIAGVLASGLLAAEGPNTLDLDGREVVVRLYKDRRWKRSTEFVTRTLAIEGRKIELDFPDTQWKVAIILAEDQKDEVVRFAIGEWPYRGHKPGRGGHVYLTIAPQPTSGRELVARIYRDWKQRPEEYQKATTVILGKTVTLTLDDVNEPAVAAIFGEDQQDELVKKRMGYRVYGWAYKPGLRFSLPDEVSPDPNDFYWIFVDALGNPLQSATIELYLHHPNWRVLVDKGVVDDTGQWKTRFQVRASNIGLDGSRCHLFVVSHPDYGAAEVKIYQTQFREHIIILPFVPADSEAYQRSAWGVVVDPNNNPVCGAMVEATSLRVRGGDWIEGALAICYCVRTDKQGKFRVYMPVNPKNEAIGPLIPPKAEYQMRVEPPQKLGMAEYQGSIPTGQASVITLARRSGYFHTFAFGNQNDVVINRKLFQWTRIRVRRQNARDTYIEYEEWKDGGFFPLGTYEVDMPLGRDGREHAFEPVEVTADSPERIFFKPIVLAPKVYYGRVVHGVTGEPMAGVSVRDLTSRPPTVEEKRDASKKTRSDEAGRFELKRPGHIRTREIEIYEPNYLTILIKNSLFKEDPKGNFELPLTRMFPAARVIVEPWMHKTNIKEQRYHGHPSLEPELMVDVNNNPPWAKDFLTAGIDDFRDRDHRGYSLDTNDGPESFYVPAGLNLQLQLRPSYDKEWSPITIAENVKLEQGQVLDLGRVEIKRALSMFVDVTEGAGEPVEGVPVTACDQYGRTTSYTDENGVAIFSLARDSKGEFLVEYKPAEDTDGPHLREAMPYEITGVADANSVLTLKVSDEILYHLFK
jgi:hypothetical protein